MADSAASTIPDPTRARSQKRRTSTVSPETENKLARAARSAQRLAQLSDVPRDDTTLDLFPDDPTRATVEAMNIDVRQGTLQGFELPDVVLAAVGVPEGAGFAAAHGASLDAKSARRAPRVAGASKEDAAGDASLDGQMVIETEPLPGLAPSTATVASHPDAEANAGPSTDEPNATQKAVVSAQSGSSMAAASVVRSIAALRQSSEPDQVEELRPATPGTASQRVATAFANPASVAPEPGSAAPAATTAAAQPARATPYAAPAPTHASHATPELDHARATAFADTVDALYGVIADQRRSAGDHSRRMKWMLTIVVCALLMTVAIGITQTLLLFRLSADSKTQQQRIEQMMLNQQATLATLLDTDSSNTSIPAPTLPAVTPAPVAAAAPKAADPHTQRAPPAHHRKSAHTH